ncbi:MAG: hypothetical protein KA350_05935, partial [Arenimonas sp.]|nr:hypothetical protein [Arenimonas sp.]
GHPLPALFRHTESLLKAINGIFDSPTPNFSIWHLHRVLNSLALPLADFDGMNINEPQQWREFNLSLNNKL